MTNVQLEKNITEYLYRKNRQIARRIAGGMRRTRLNRNVNGTKNVTDQKIIKLCSIMERRGDLTCVAKEKGPAGHKIYSLSQAKKLEMDIEKGKVKLSEEE